MNFICIISCAFLIATVKSFNILQHPSTSSPDDPFGYYDDYNSEDNRVEENRLEDQNVQDSSLPPTFISKSERVVVKEGENATLHCLAKNAEDLVFIWRRDQEVVSQGNFVFKQDLYALLPDKSLFIKNVKPSVTGPYSCEIQITQNPKPTLNHRLKLENDIEIISLRPEGNVTQLYTGDTLRLTCKAIGTPSPTIKWYFDGNEQMPEVQLESNRVQTHESSDILVLENVNFKNNGTYRCMANNQKSYDQRSIVIEVFDKGRDAASHTDSRISRGLQLAPSLMVLLTTIMLMNP